MDYEKFKSKVCALINSLSIDFRCDVKKVERLTGKVEEMFVFQPLDKKDGLAPMLSTKLLYDSFTASGCTLGILIGQLLKKLKNDSVSKKSIPSLENFEEARGRLTLDLFNPENINVNSLIGVSLCEDLFLGVSLIIADGDDLIASIPIPQDVVDIWKLNSYEVLLAAFENTPRVHQPAIYGAANSMQALICDTDDGAERVQLRNLLDCPPVRLHCSEDTYIITSSSITAGSICLFFDSVLCWLAASLGTYTVFPISRFETLAVRGVHKMQDLGLCDIVNNLSALGVCRTMQLTKRGISQRELQSMRDTLIAACGGAVHE